jgi:hypothetical protein
VGLLCFRLELVTVRPWGNTVEEATTRKVSTSSLWGVLELGSFSIHSANSKVVHRVQAIVFDLGLRFNLGSRALCRRARVGCGLPRTRGAVSACDIAWTLRLYLRAPRLEPLQVVPHGQIRG